MWELLIILLVCTFDLLYDEFSELVLTPDYMQVVQQYILGEPYGRGHMLSANIVYYSYVYVHM